MNNLLMEHGTWIIAMITLDDAERKAIEIQNDVIKNFDKIKSEEDAKIQIINRILNECLDWPYTDFRAENHHESGFSDYILIDNQKPVLLIEAKRLGIFEIRTAEKNQVRHLKISGSSLKEAMSGIDQAASYSLANGIPITVLTDGITWIIFKTFIPGENFKTKEAIVFPSLEAVISDFSHFFDLLSKQQFKKRVYNSIFDQIHNNRLLLKQVLMAPLEESEIKIIQKSDIAFDLDRVFTNFFSRLTGDDDEDLLIECFVETRESRIADFSLEKMTTSVLGNITPLDKNVDSELINLITSNIEVEDPHYETGQTVFIVGPTGAGKTTFLDRFFRKTLPDAVRRRCIVVGVNCLDATGREDTALEWLTESLISALEKGVYEEGFPSWNDLLGLYHREYKRRSTGVDAVLYEKDKDQFKVKFGEFLSERVESDREGYLKRILSDAVNNRKMLPIIVVDNTDEFSNEYKQKFFQFSQALRRHANHCLLIFPVTDKSAWSFSKTDIYGIYKSRSFFLPTPSPREVFRKRINFLKQKLSNDKVDKKEKGGYFSSRGIKISIENLGSFAHVLENIFVDHDYTSKTIGELTNYNIRRTLLLSQRVITSPVIKIEDIIKSYVSGDIVTTNFTRFMDALIKGDYEAYKQGDNHEIYPIFQVDSDVRQSPLINLRILSLLESIHNSGRTVEEKHLGIQSIVDYFDAIGCPEVAVDKALISLLEAGLIEPYDVSNRDLSNNQKISISYKGMAHLRLASHNSVFFYQMALTTAISDQDIALKLRSCYKSNASFSDKLITIKSTFLAYLIQEDKQFISIEYPSTQYDCQKELTSNLDKFVHTHPTQDNDLVAFYGDEYREGVFKEDVLATVEFYDCSKGFGFIEVEGLDSKIFVHSEKLQKFGVEALKDGDSILCDLARGKKGIYVSKIHDIETDASQIEVVKCRIVRLFRDRGYGFVQLTDKDRTAYFHISVFSQDLRNKIQEGDFLEAEIGPDRNGDGFQIKQIISIPDSNKFLSS
ncbi:cold shock domain-containing protein [Methylomonas sp. 11b]|uniref:cold shock domain-containing protein n=1 Tax=Methylomonas sp. 11b TaxID=1168169 RepID=UPI001E556B13|nr:cold shock domain-containing protein [Methylomonas sp. 11b]